MPRFMVIGNYSAEGARGLMAAGGSARRTAVEKMVSALGGRIETFDFGFGGDDVYVIVDMPDSESAAAVALTVSGSGAVRARTIVLLSPEQLDRAAQLRPDYAPPGQTG
ncbi:GYD domain-containing protein [Modestobacter excelsi]|uniref:GYD domain-containing protein n=1 Tax=Modestobacter excelsi TaxID=2213161 RepID=UPI00110D0B17|nr:GYD domain-containing protein [Modestobacter excelsi]